MEFELTEEQILLKESIADFANKVLKPKASHYDETEEWPTEHLKQMAELGLMGMMTEEAYGGAEMDMISYIVASEELNRGDAATGVIFSVHNSLVQSPIRHWGTEEQKKKYLPLLASGEWIGCYCLSEPEAGSDAANQQTTAKLVGDKYILNGTKNFITNGSNADLAIIFASTDKSMKHKGISAFLVEKNFPGYQVGPLEKKLGINASGTSQIILEDCEVPKENLFGPGEGGGFKVAMHTLDGGRIGIASQAVGIGQACLDEALAFSSQRVCFGQTINNFQAIQWKLANMATELEAARLLVYRAGWLKQNNKPCSKEASMAKLYASEACNRAAYEAVQVHGGYGFCKEYTVERLYRDARITTIYEGTSEIQRIVIARNLFT